MTLNQCREQIDDIDVQILALLNRRAEISKYIGSLKMQAGLPVADSERELDILRRIARDNPGDLDDGAASRIYESILAESRQIQEKIRAGIMADAGIAE
ncbi:MAG: chorismate mutase [Pyrinomonadaceae bacterium]|nr:chorismate mutase [Pyrinomonadaceae bacterium]